jgi:hypothetical protein
LGRISALKAEKADHNIGFQEKRNISAPKLAKIDENSIDP